MARSLRIEYPGAFYHVFSRGVAKQVIFKTDEDRARFLHYLDLTIQRHNWVLHAYCLMDNHFHLLVETPDPNLSKGMHLLNGRYAQWFNYINDRVGHVFQGRYGCGLIQKEEYFLKVACYIVLNPVEGGVVEHPSHYRWSSYTSTAGIDIPPSFLTISSILLCFSDDLPTAQKLYRESVEHGIDNEAQRRIESGGICGTEEFCEQIHDLVKDKVYIRDIPRQQRFMGRPSIAQIFDGWVDLQERDEGICRAVHKLGYKQSEVADYLGLAPSTVSTIVKREGSYLHSSINRMTVGKAKSEDTTPCL